MFKTEKCVIITAALHRPPLELELSDDDGIPVKRDPFDHWDQDRYIGILRQ